MRVNPIEQNATAASALLPTRCRLSTLCCLPTFCRRISTLCLFLLLLCSPSLSAQTEADRVSVGGALDLHGSLGSLDGSIRPGAEVFLRWNIVPRISLIARMGINTLGFSNNDALIAGDPGYFGGPTDSLYPVSNARIFRETDNSTPLIFWSASGTWNLLPDEKIVPYLTAGLGLAAFTPRNADQGSELPNSITDSIFSSPTLLFLLGGGAEWYIDTDLALTGELRLNLAASDYLDDYDDGGLGDAFITLSLGASYYIVGELDCDEDGLSDREEERIGTDPCLLDTDGDRLDDIVEIRQHGTDPLKEDSDGDGLGDADEIERTGTDPLRADSDGDRLDDGAEINEHKTDPINADSDGDRLGDGEEVLERKTNPLVADSDGDGLDDGTEVRDQSTDPNNPDTDGDDLGDGPEVLEHRSNPLQADSDSDSLRDGDEVRVYRTSPIDADSDDDRLTDGAEVQRIGTDPNNPDTDADGVGDADDACPLVAGVRKRNGCPAAPEVGTITDFPAVYFKKDSDQFDFAQEGTTESLAMIMSYVNQCPGLRVLIEGHASREGTEARNRTLSELRADRVRTWLVERGINTEKVAGTIGYGSSRNAVEEPDPGSAAEAAMDPVALEDLRKKNRRIAVRVVRTCEEE